MIGLGGLEKDQGNLDEALAWYEKAWDASRGSRTRVSLGGVYLARLLELSPDNPAAIRETGPLLLAEISDQNCWAKTHAWTISRLSNRLLEWSSASASTESKAVLDELRSEMKKHCGAVGMAKENTEICESFLVPADSA